VKRGELSPELVARIDASAGFREAFGAIHSEKPYSALLHVEEAWLPMEPADEATLQHPLQLGGEKMFDLVFVDGCKSWFATKRFMEAIAHVVEPGAHLIFKDYGWFTCFWIPAFVHGLRDHLSLVAHVDATYEFELTRSFTARDVRASFPDRADELGIAALSTAFAEVVDLATERGDLEAHVFHTLQQIAALRACGEMHRGRQLSCLMAGRWTGRTREMIEYAFHVCERKILGLPGNRPTGSHAAARSSLGKNISKRDFFVRCLKASTRTSSSTQRCSRAMSQAMMPASSGSIRTASS